jgi:hypothetical protein
MESPIAMYVPNFACPPTDPLEPELEPVPELDPEELEVDPELDPEDPEPDPEDIDPLLLEPEEEPPLEEELSDAVLEEPPHAAARPARNRTLAKDVEGRTRTAYPTIGIVPVSTASLS